MAEAEAREVDEDGEPETPAKQAVDKRKKRNMTYAGLALGAVAVVIGIVTLRNRSASASSGAPTFPTLPQGSVLGADQGAGGPSSSGDPFAALESQLSTQNQQQLAATAGLGAALNRLASELHASGGANKGDQARTLPHLNAASYARLLPKGATVDVIGADPTAGHYSGSNLRLGAPLYALVGGQWRQGVAPGSAPAGTLFGTLPQFAGYIAPPTAPKLPAPVASPPHA